MNQYPSELGVKANSLFPADTTIQQNLDRQIDEAEKRLKHLREVKARMESSGLLQMRIDDIQQALRW